MTYPYIGEGIKSGSTALIYEQSKCVAIESKTWAVADLELCDGINEDKFKNITAEYLANTYGEVKSKEHAEFIVKLAEVNGFTIEFISNFEAKSFIIKNECLSIFNIHINGLDKENLNKITIPLPPECEKPPIGGGQSMDYNNCRCSTAPALNDEWPKVGDDAEICESPAFELSVKSSKFIGKKGIVRAKFENSDGVMVYVLEVNTENVFCFYLQNIKKTKTPEQELREFLSLLWEENNHDFDMLLDVVTEHVIKKPQ